MYLREKRDDIIGIRKSIAIFFHRAELAKKVYSIGLKNSYSRFLADAAHGVERVF